MLQRLWLTGFALCLLVAGLTGHSAEAENTEVRILVDISGSMKQTDPNNLRIPAINLLTELMPEGSQAGIWTFAHYVHRLQPPALVNSQWRSQAKTQAATINSVGLFTNLTQALDDALQGLSKDEGQKHSVILLTDGYIDMPEGSSAAHQQRLLTEILPQYQALNVQIHALALSQDVDKELLQTLASATQGLYLEVLHSDDLLPAFLKAFDRAVESEQVPLSDNRFQIDASVSEFTALIFRGSSGTTKLISPSGQVYDSVRAKQDPQLRWHHDLGFELITLQAPEPGQWQVDAQQDPNSRVQVLSDLKLKVTGVPATLFAGNAVEMQIMLTEQEQIVTTPQVLRNAEVRLAVTAPDGRVGVKVLSDVENIPSSGIYKEIIQRLEAEGEYQFQVQVVGKTFERRQTVVAHLAAPLKLRQQTISEQEKLVLMITPDDSVDPLLTRLHLNVVAPDGRSFVQELRFNREAQGWHYELTADYGPGRYTLEINGRIKLHQGQTLNYRPDAIPVNFPLGLSQAQEHSGAAVIHKTAEETAENGIELPNLAQAYEQQQQSLQTPEEPPVEVPETAEESSVWWLYAALASVVLTVIAALCYWFLRDKKPAVSGAATTESDPAVSEQAEAQSEAEAAVIPEDLIQEDIAADEEPTEGLADEAVAGDFDDFADEDEIEIPIPEQPDNDDLDDGFNDFDDFDREFALDPDADNADKP